MIKDINFEQYHIKMYPSYEDNPSKRIFVGNLPNSVNEDVLRKEFSAYGRVEKVDLKVKGIGDAQTQFAFITLVDTSDHDVNKCKYFTSVFAAKQSSNPLFLETKVSNASPANRFTENT